MIKTYLVFFGIVFCAITNAQITLTEVLIPQYIEGNSNTNSNRIPCAFRVSLTGLTPSATYRYINQVVIATDVATSSGAGNIIFANTPGTFSRTTGAALSTAGNYSTFTADVSGGYIGWFITETTGNARFTSGNNVFFRIILNNGSTGTTAATYLTTTSSATVVNLAGSGTNSGTGIRMSTNTNLTAGNFIMLFDNPQGTGRPISGSFVESDGTANTTANSYAAFYVNNVDAVSKAFGAILPNTLPNGIQFIQEYSLTTGVTTVNNTNNTSIWPKVGGGTVSTINPSGGTTEIALDGSTIVLPVTLSSFNAVKISAASNQIFWATANAQNFSHFELERKTDGRNFSQLGTFQPNVTSIYSFADKQPWPINYYRLKIIDKDGTANYSKIVAIVNANQGFAVSNVYPTLTTGLVTVEAFAANATKINCSIVNLAGQQVLAQTYTADQSFKQTIDISSLANGSYVLKLSTESGQSSFKLVKQ